MRVTVQQVQASTFEVVGPLYGPGAEMTLGRCLDVRGLGFADVRHLVSGGITRTWVVGDDLYPSLEAAVEAINARERR